MATTTSSGITSNPLTNSAIDSLVSAYSTQQTTNRVTPLQAKLTSYQNINSAYSVISSKLSTLNDSIKALQVSGSTSAFTSKTGTTSNSNFVGITASGLASASSYAVRVNQIAKNDIVLAQTLSSTGNNTDITGPGTQTFVIVTGDGQGGQNTSHLSVNFADTDFTDGKISNQKVLDKIQGAISSNQASVLSNSVTGSTTSSGSFTLTLGGTAKTINYSAGSYSDVMDSIVSQVNQISGITAEKVSDNSGGYTLKFTVTDQTKNISIGSDTGSLVSDLNIATTNEIGAGGVVNATAFAPSPGNYQLSLTSKQTGNDNRIISLSDNSGSKALSTMGLNLGGTRPAFSQSGDGSTTAGFTYATSQLNSKFEFNGLNLERNSNTVTDLVKGVSLQLNSVMQSTDSTVNLSVSSDTNTIGSKIQTFITNFNDLYTYLKTNTAITIDASNGNTRGALCGDATAQTLLNLFSSVAYSQVSGIDSKQLNTLSKIGITFDINSGLSMSNITQLKNAINNNPDQLNNLFNSTNGIANNLNARITPYLGTGGYLSNSEASLNRSITAVKDNITTQQARVTKDSDNVRNQYLQLQQQYNQIIYMQTFINQNSTFFSG